MTYHQDQFEKFIDLVDNHSTQDGVNYSTIEKVGTFKASTIQGRHPMIDLRLFGLLPREKRSVM